MKEDLILKGFRINWKEISEDSYLRNISSIYGLEEFRFRCPVTCFSGENGSGKSTLLEAIAAAYGFNPEGGTRNYSFSTRDSHSELCSVMSLIKSGKKAEWGYYLRAESFYNVATKEEEYFSDRPDLSDRLHEKSHGESFLSAGIHHFRPNGLYLLDEPESALSVQGQLSFFRAIYDCVKNGSQFIMATHSPVLLAFPDACILTFDEGKIHEISYEDTDSYRLSKMFLNYRESVIKKLLED